MHESLLRAIRKRAGHACEYCRMPDVDEDLPLSIDHNLTGIDPLTRKVTLLFHPRRHRWSRHFCWDGPNLVGLTAVGRTTIHVLAMNDPLVVNLREVCMKEGIFPVD